MDGPQSPRRKKLFAVADSIGLRRDERIELAQYLLRRDVESWGQLTEEQVARMLDALEGYELVTALLELRPEHSDDGVVAERAG
jgi:hypothetical protein